MKATGMVRRIDELGRIVIPKEIRRTLKIKEGTPLEIFSGDNGELIFTKYSPVLELEDVSSDVCESIYSSIEKNVFICDKERVISAKGGSNFKKNFINKNITLDLEKAIENRKSISLNKSDGANLIPLIKEEYFCNAIIIVPIVSSGDTFGAIVICSDDNLTNAEVKIAKSFANFISLQINF